MSILNIRDPHGVVHGLIDHRTTHCFTRIEVGWGMVEDGPTCIGCVARNPETLDFAHRVASRIAWQAQKQSFEEILNTVTLRKGDTLNYRHTFILDCSVAVDDKGNLILEEAL